LTIDLCSQAAIIAKYSEAQSLPASDYIPG
jgi:hypothetical protein